MINEVFNPVAYPQMRGKSGVSRADLLWAFAVLEESRHESLAEILGFEQNTQTVSPDKHRTALNRTEPEDRQGTDNSVEEEVIQSDENATPPHSATASYYRVISHHKDQTQPQTETSELSLPDWFTQAAPTLLEECATRIPAIHRIKPLHTGLTAWPRVLTFLQRVLGDRVEGRQPDTVKLVKQAANVKTIRRIPHRQRQHWAPQARLLIDINDDNFPYRRDFLHLRDRLLQARGNEGLAVQYCYDEPGGYIVHYQQQREIIEPWAKPAQNTPILILSDLGRHAQSRQTLYAWLAFGQMLNAQGFRATVLMPAAKRQINPRLLRFFDCVVWDRASRLKPVKGDYQVEHDQCDHATNVEQLLVSLFAGVRIDSSLLRAVRYGLLHGCDIGHETAIWRHAAVMSEGDEWGWQAASKPNYFAQAQSLIKALSPAQQQKLVELIGRYHAQYPDELYFEAMYNLKLLGLPLPLAVEKATEKFLRDMVRTYQAHADNSLLHAWVKRHLVRHEAKPIRQQHRYWTALMAFAKKRDEQLGGTSTSEWPSDLSDEEKKTAWDFLNATQVLRVYQLRQSGQNLVLVPEKSAAQADGSQTDLPDAWSTHAIAGTTLLTLRLTDTHIFHTHTDRQGRQTVVSLNLESSCGHSFQFPATGQHTFQIGAEHITVDVSAAQQRKADWMTFIGSGSDGMFAESRDAQNRVYRWYWHAPILINRQTLYPGFWYSEPQSLHAKFKPDWAGGAGRDEYGLHADAIIAGIRHRFRWIEPTSFLMGSPEDEAGRYDDELQHPVILTQGYWLAETTCTQELWQGVMGENPSEFKGDQLPVETVSWDDVQNFLKKLNKLNPKLKLRLPTEAEWENACRAGAVSAFHFEGEITLDKVNYRGTWEFESDKWGEESALRQSAEVKRYAPNAWGVYQMHGNVWECCQDRYGEYPVETVIDPQGPSVGGSHVQRGGSWHSRARRCRSACRRNYDSSNRNFGIGFRLAQSHELKSSRVLGAG